MNEAIGKEGVRQSAIGGHGRSVKTDGAEEKCPGSAEQGKQGLKNKKSLPEMQA